MAKIQSVEPNIADLANGWLKSYKRDYKLEQESLNTEIDQALNDYYSKNGGVGGNRPDAKLLLQDKNLVNYPILIEYKGYKDASNHTITAQGHFFFIFWRNFDAVPVPPAFSDRPPWWQYPCGTLPRLHPLHAQIFAEAEHFQCAVPPIPPSALQV